MKTTHGTKTIEVIIEVDVTYEKVRSIEGSDADGCRGMVETEYVPMTTELVTLVPEAVEQWAKTKAIEIFERE